MKTWPWWKMIIQHCGERLETAKIHSYKYLLTTKDGDKSGLEDGFLVGFHVRFIHGIFKAPDDGTPFP